MYKWLNLLALGSLLIALPRPSLGATGDDSCRLVIQLRPGVKFDSSNWSGFKILSTLALDEKAALPAIGANTGLLQIRQENKAGYELFWRSEANGPSMHLDREHFQSAFKIDFPNCQQVRQLSAQFLPRSEQSQLALELKQNGVARGFSWGHFFLSLENSMYFRRGYWVDERPFYQKYDSDLQYYRDQLKIAPTDFLERLNFLTSQIFARESFEHYCAVSNTETSTYLYNCTACQGQTWTVLAILRDLQIQIPEPYELGVQFFKDHVRPVLWDRSKERLKDLVYGGKWEINLQEPIYKPEVLLTYFLLGPDSGLNANQIAAQDPLNYGCYVITSPDPKIQYNFLRCSKWTQSWFKRKSPKPQFAKDAPFIGLWYGGWKTHIDWPRGSDLKTGILTRKPFQDGVIDGAKKIEKGEVVEGDNSRTDSFPIPDDEMQIFTKLLAHRDQLATEDKELVDQLFVNSFNGDDLAPSVTKDSVTDQYGNTKTKTYSYKKFAPKKFDLLFAQLRSRLSIDHYLQGVGEARRIGDSARMIDPIIDVNELPDTPDRVEYVHKWKNLSLIERTLAYENLLYEKWENLFLSDSYTDLKKILTSRPDEVFYTEKTVSPVDDFLLQVMDQYRALENFRSHIAGIELRDNFRLREFNNLIVTYAKNLGEQHRRFLERASQWTDDETMWFFNFDRGIRDFSEIINSDKTSEMMAPTSMAVPGINVSDRKAFRFKELAMYPLTSLFEEMLKDSDFVYTAKKNAHELEQVAKLRARYSVLERWTPAVDIELPRVAPKDACKDQTSGIYVSGGFTVECKPSSETLNNTKIVLRLSKTLPARFLFQLFQAQSDEFLLFPPNQLLMAMSWSEDLEKENPPPEVRTVMDKLYYKSAFLVPTRGSYMKREFQDGEIATSSYPDARNLSHWLETTDSGDDADGPPQFWETNTLLRTGYLMWTEQSRHYVSQLLPVLTMRFGLTSINYDPARTMNEPPRFEEMNLDGANLNDDEVWLFVGHFNFGLPSNQSPYSGGGYNEIKNYAPGDFKN